MVEAFAVAADLGKMLNRTFAPGEETDWIDELLANASTYLRGVIGQDVFPQTTSEFVAYPDGGRVDLPQYPIVSVDSVERDGVPVDFTYRPGYITLDSDDPADVTFTWGLTVAPDELKRLACVLVSQVMLPIEAGLGLTAGGLSSAALDDFKLAWADAGASSGMVLTPIAIASVQKQFGRGGSTVMETVR